MGLVDRYYELLKFVSVFRYDFESQFIASIEIDIDDEVLTDAMILPNQVVLRVVAQLNAIVPQNFKVVGPVVP